MTPLDELHLLDEHLLDELRLGPAERRALERQGFVRGEPRPAGGTQFKLRFRVEGCQRVISLGVDPGRAAQVSAAVVALQRRRYWERRLAARDAQLRAILKTIRPRLAKQAAAVGLRLHGRRLRRARVAIAGGSKIEIGASVLRFETILQGGAEMIANKEAFENLSEESDVEPGPDDAGLVELRRQKLLAFIEESMAKLTALEGVIGLVTADLLSFLEMYRQDLDEYRTELATARERFDLMTRASEQIYKLSKQIDLFIKSTIWLERQRQDVEQGRPKRRPFYQ